MSINKEKQQIIDTSGNILVTANPGTGKTLLLAHKYLSLIENGIKPKEILCLTFTEKAKREMEDRIVKLTKEQKTNLDIKNLNVYTFHSYALNSLNSNEIISPNLLRFTIYLYIKENKILNYSDKYILDTLVPKIENLIRYLKSFGILPNKINIRKAKKFLPSNSKLTNAELEKFLDEFTKIYSNYETIKKTNGFDYSDLLIEFLSLKNTPVFEYVLIDELQDVNKMEAEIALKSAKQFIAVGDKKQAIFGFQGGSIINFELFKNSNHFVLSENFRSTNQILNYSKEYFSSKTKDSSHKEELKDLKNALGSNGDEPNIVEVLRKNLLPTVVNLIGVLSDDNKKTAVILRTNNQISELASELENNSVEFSTTFFSGSEDAKNDIITFLKGVLSNSTQEIKNAMFTPYFPISIQDAFVLTDNNYENTSDLLKDCRQFYKLRKSIKTKYDLIKLFKEIIIPISLSYGRQYYLAAEKINKAFFESLTLLDDRKLANVFDYLQSFDLSADEIEEEKGIVLTTIHKAKGKEFDNVIYVPTTTKNQTNFVDDTVEAILKSHGIQAEEELEEEQLRINFVAFTRAKEALFIVTEKSSEYSNEFSKNRNFSDIKCLKNFDTDSYKRDAYSLFVNRDYEKAKSLLENNNIWLTDYIHNYFSNLKSLSFSSAETKPFKFLLQNILNISEYSPALKLGSEIHLAAEKYLKNEEYLVEEEFMPYWENIQNITNTIKLSYPEIYEVEQFFNIEFPEISDIEEDINFRGKIDAVFTDGSKFLIVDWKTDRNTDRASEHRQQLVSYKNAFCELNNIDKDLVDIGIAFIGLRSTINTGVINSELDLKKPGKNVFNTFLKKVNKVIQWKNSPDLFLKELSEDKVKSNERLWKSVVDQYLFEVSKI